MIFDTHAHYDDSAFDPDRKALLSSMPAAGVNYIVNPGCDLPSSRAAVALAHAFPHVYAAVGYHPENCAPYVPTHLEELRALAGDLKVVAVGEIGLDYYWPENPPRAHQQAVFRAQLALAEELSLPVIVHDREAHGDCLAIVKEFPRVRGVFHCYSGSAEMAKELLKLGWYLGFDGPITYKNNRKTAETAAMCPLDRMLLETDAPYLSPVPMRGKRNDSRNIRYIAERIAHLRGVTPEEILQTACENALRFYGISREVL
ncbi:MAG: TatD family hydrolase [Clostridia bacterium]|nr:TatD family hydrolase [Clostridia bacterium]